MSELDSTSLEVYMPEFCVQGERIPFYVLWDASKKLAISMNLSDGLVISEVYNADSADLQNQSGDYAIRKFEVNGYFGGIIGSTIYEQPSSIKKVKFLISDENGSNIAFDKFIELFRPDVQISDNVSHIIIKTNKQNKIIADNRISLYNRGKGTGIVRINILKESEIEEGFPEGFEEFKTKFSSDLNEGLLKLKTTYSNYSDTIESIRVITNNPLPAEPDKLQQVKTTLLEMEQVFDNDEAFFHAFLQTISLAYLKNMSIMTNVDAFLAFMKSMGNNKLILLDAMKVLKISTTPKKFSAELIVTDLVQNKYPVIKLPVLSIVSDKDCVIPIYYILNSSS